MSKKHWDLRRKYTKGTPRSELTYSLHNSTKSNLVKEIIVPIIGYTLIPNRKIFI